MAEEPSRTLTEDELQELRSYLDEAYFWYVKASPSPIPGFATCKFDISFTLPKPLDYRIDREVDYLINGQGEGENKTLELWAFSLADDAREALDELDRKLEEGQYEEGIDEDGEKVKYASTDVPVTLLIAPIELHTDPPRRLTLQEAVTWLAVQEADSEEKALRILALAYPGVTFERVYTPSDEGPTSWSVDDAGEEGEKSGLPVVDTARIITSDFPIDKVNSNLWTSLKNSPDGQYGLFFGDESTASFNMQSEEDERAGLDPLYTTFYIDFSELDDVPIAKRLTPYDKRVYMAVGACFNTSGPYMSYRQIYQAMGYNGKPNKTDRDKIDKSLTKMGRAPFMLDNAAEAERYSYDRFVYDGPFLPMERVRGIVDGQVVEGVIHAYREPPMLSFAKERGQFTTVKVALLSTPLNKTDANIVLEDYLIERIARMKRSTRKGERSRGKILFNTLYEKVGITTKKRRQRASEKITRVLDHYKSCGFIDDYRLVGDGIDVSYTGTRTKRKKVRKTVPKGQENCPEGQENCPPSS